MIRIYYKKPGAADWNFITARDEAEAAHIRAGLMAEGYEVQ